MRNNQTSKSTNTQQPTKPLTQLTSPPKYVLYIMYIFCDAWLGGYVTVVEIIKMCNMRCNVVYKSFVV